MTDTHGTCMNHKWGNPEKTLAGFQTHQAALSLSLSLRNATEGERR